MYMYGVRNSKGQQMRLVASSRLRPDNYFFFPFGRLLIRNKNLHILTNFRYTVPACVFLLLFLDISVQSFIKRFHLRSSKLKTIEPAIRFTWRDIVPSREIMVYDSVERIGQFCATVLN